MAGKRSPVPACIIGKSTSPFYVVTVSAFVNYTLTSHLAAMLHRDLLPTTDNDTMQHRGSSSHLTPRRCAGPELLGPGLYLWWQNPPHRSEQDAYSRRIQA